MRVRRLSRGLISFWILLAAPLPALAADDYGSLGIWDISGVTGDSESYENQLVFVLSPRVKLGRIWSAAPMILAPVSLSAELSLGVELAGNDGRFRGSNFSGPAGTPGGAEAIAVNELGMVTGADSGQVDGTARRALLSDLWFGVSQPRLYRVPLLGVDVGAAVSLLLPTSAPSQNTGLHASLGGGVTLGRSFFGRLDLGYSFRYSHYFYAHTTNDVRTLSGEVEINGRLEPVYQPNRGTALNPEFALINEFSLDLRLIAGLSLAASYSLVNTFTHALSGVEISGAALADPCADAMAVAAAAGGEVVACGDRAQRDSHWFQLHLTYQVLPMLGIKAGLSTMQPVRHEGGGISNPFVQNVPTANYTTLELGLRVGFEETAAAFKGLRGGKED